MYDYLEISKQDFLTLKKHYQQALEEGKEQFTFKGHEFLTSYAKYFTEYLEAKFEKES